MPCKIKNYTILHQSIYFMMFIYDINVTVNSFYV